MLVTDQIIAFSEEQARREIARLYPDADDFELVSRRDSSGHYSSRGHVFTFQIDVPVDYTDYDEDYLDGDPGDLGEEEY
jgi:hypothetical protein